MRSISAIFTRSASACLLILLSYATAAAQADQWVAGAGGSGGNDFQARCPTGQHLLGFNLRAGDNIDAIQPICGVPLSETEVQVRDRMRGYGGTGGSPAQVVCPSQSTSAAPTPVVLGLDVRAEGINGYVLNSIGLYCGIVAAQQRMPGREPVAQYSAPMQDSTYGALASGSHVKYRSAQPMCPPGLIGVGVYGRAGAAVDWLGLICGAAQTGFTVGRTLGKRKRPPDETAGRTLGKRKLPKDETAGRTLGKRRLGAGAESAAAAAGALAAARASVDPAIYDRYIGKYLVNALDYFTISREGDRLYVVRDKKFELIPRSETDFSVGSSEALIRFNKSPEGRVLSLTYMGQSDYAPVYWREGVQPPVKSPF